MRSVLGNIGRVLFFFFFFFFLQKVDETNIFPIRTEQASSIRFLLYGLSHNPDLDAILEWAGTPSMHTLLKQRRLRWLGHVVRMDDGQILKDLRYGELVQGKRPTGRPLLRYKDVCKRDLKALEIDLNRWETLASDRSAWRQAVQ